MTKQFVDQNILRKMSSSITFAKYIFFLLENVNSIIKVRVVTTLVGAVVTVEPAVAWLGQL